LHTLLRRFVSISLAAVALSAPAQLRLASGHPIALRGGEGAAAFTLTNSGTAPLPLALTPGPVVDSNTHAILLKAKVTLAPVVGIGIGGLDLPKTIPPGETLSLQATVTGVSTSSAAEVTIFNGNTQLGSIDLIEIDAPLNISIDGNGSPDKPLAYALGKPAVIALTNGDPQPYRVHWVFQLHNRAQAAGDLDIAANGGARITIEPSKDGYSLIDVIHPSAKQGVLLLSVAGPANVPSGLLPARTLPVSLLMRRVGETASTTISYAYAGLLLFLGGILSVLASSVLPNMQKKADLRAQLQDLANRTTSVSTRIDSYLRVLLRLERKAIEIAIGEASAWLPASSNPLDQVAEEIDTLDKRLTAAETLDDLRRKHEQASATAPPSVTDDIDSKLQAAADQLHSLALSGDALAAANGFLTKAQTTLDTLNDSATMASLIAGKVAALRVRLAKFPADYSDLEEALPGVFVIIKPDSGFDDAKNIVPPMLFAIDHGVAAIHLALDYVMVRTSIPDEDTKGCDDAGKTTRDRLAKHHCALIDLLGTLSWRALRDATKLVQQMREDIYEDDIFREIGKPGQAEITYDTQKPRPYLPVFFTIKFKNDRYNSAAAIQCMACDWWFPDALGEHGWKVCHYFTGEEKVAAISCSTAAAGQASASQAVPTHSAHMAHKSEEHKPEPAPPMDTIVINACVRGQKSRDGQQPAESPITRTIDIQRNIPSEYSRFLAELLRFAIAFAVALASLLSGALDQLGKLDFIPATIAIIALGFGADSIKNLLTQAPKKS